MSTKVFMYQKTLIACLMMVCLSSCTGPNPNDPYEPLNRNVFEFNQLADKVIIRPIAVTYDYIVPDLIKHGIRNTFTNLTLLPSSLFNLIQGKTKATWISLQRFTINSTLGILGLFDPASDLDIQHVERQTFDSTMRFWGYDKSDFIILPILGGTTVRGVIAYPVDGVIANPQHYIGLIGENEAMAARITSIISTRAAYLQQDRIINESIDPYASYRSMYMQQLQADQSQEDADAIADLFADD